MASASLVHPAPVAGGVAYEIETWPFESRPFEGPADRDWASFELDAPGRATFAWRSRADRVHAAIRALERGGAAADALMDGIVAEYVAVIARGVRGMPRASLVDLAAAILPGLCWGDLVEPGGPWSAYRSDEAGFVEDAAAALELPEWASVTRVDGALRLVIEAGRSLAELAAWMQQRAAEP
jgi:hypothetical protein